MKKNLCIYIVRADTWAHVAQKLTLATVNFERLHIETYTVHIARVMVNASLVVGFISLLVIIAVVQVLNNIYTRSVVENLIENYDETHRRDVRLCRSAELATCGTPGECQRVECYKFRDFTAPRCQFIPDVDLNGETCDDNDPDTPTSVCVSGICEGASTPTAPPPPPSDLLRVCNSSELALCGAPSECTQFDCRIIDEQTSEPVCILIANVTSDGLLCDDNDVHTNVSACYEGSCRADVVRLCNDGEVLTNCGALSSSSPCRKIGCIIMPSGLAFCAEHANETASGLSCDYDGGYLDYLPLAKCHQGQCVPLQTATCSEQAATSPVTLYLGAQHTVAFHSDIGKISLWGSSYGYGIGTIVIGSTTFPPYLIGYVPLRNFSFDAPYLFATEAAAADASVCVLFNNSRVLCFGSGTTGALGRNSTLDIGNGLNGQYAHVYAVPDYLAIHKEMGEEVLVKHIFAGPTAGVYCVIFVNDRFKCWGSGTSGQLGNNDSLTIGDNEFVDSVPTYGYLPTSSQTVTSICIGSIHVCVITTADPVAEVHCWGGAGSGQLGYGNGFLRTASEGPLDLGYTGVDYPRQISCGGGTTCVLMELSRDVKCWGTGAQGQMGMNSTSSFGITPSTVPSVNPPIDGIVNSTDYAAGVRVDSLCNGNAFICALLNNSQVKCWGLGSTGQLGYGSTVNIGSSPSASLYSVGYVDILTATEISHGVSVTSIKCGSTHTCAVLSNQQVKCWGTGTSGQNGYGVNRGGSPGSVPANFDYVNFRPIENTEDALDCSCVCVQQNTSDTSLMYDFLVDSTGVECPQNPTPVGDAFCPSLTYTDPRCVCNSVIHTPSPTPSPI